MTDGNSDDDTVGYKRPPRHSQFRPGQSGNPRGRQKGLRNLASDVKRTLGTPVTVNEQGKTNRVSTQEAVLRRLREKALKGDARALDRLVELAHCFNNNEASEGIGASAMPADDQAILDAYVEEVLSRRSTPSEPQSDAGAKADGKEAPSPQSTPSEPETSAEVYWEMIDE